MVYLSESEWLLWGGIGVMAGSGVLAVIGLTVFIITGKSLKKKLEKEYGKPQR